MRLIAWTNTAMAVAALCVVGCGGTRSRDPNDPQVGESSFESAGNAGTSRGGADAGTAAPGEDSEGDEERKVEEADIYRFVGDRLYVLNQYRGLYVFDVSNPDRPVELGRMPLVGYPIEMYVRGTRAYAIVSDYFSYWRDEVAIDAGLKPVWGSRIVGIDLSDPSAPFEIGDVILDGYVSDTRLVGDVIYAVSNQYAYWGYYGVDAVESGRNAMVLTSIDIANPARMRKVEQETLDGSAWHVHATSNAFIVAGNGNDYQYDTTEVLYVDISSPRGQMVQRGDFSVSGYMQDDTALDVHENQLRVLTRNWNDQTTKLRIFDTTDPDTLPLLGELDYEYQGGLFGTTFDGDRMYMVHYEVIDPLEVVDLSDPTHPAVVGILEAPGWIDRIVPVGERLIGLGTDDSNGERKTSVSLIDVSNPAEPALLDRITTGEDWSWSIATWERKALSVSEEERLVLFPYSGWNNTEQKYRHLLGMIEFGDTSLTPRGQIESPAAVERGALHEGRVYCLSQSLLQVVDIRDRDEPIARATIELARNVGDYGRGTEVGVELIQPAGYDWWYGGQEPSILRVSPLDAPDGNEEIGRLQLPKAAQSLVVKGDLALAIRAGSGCYRGYYLEDGYYGCSDEEATASVMVVSIADPARPRLLSTVKLPGELGSYYEGRDQGAWTNINWQSRYGAAVGGWQGGAGALDLGDSKYAMLRTKQTSCWTQEGCKAVGIEPVHNVYDDGDYRYESWYGDRYENLLAVIDVSDPARTSVSTVDLGEGRIENLFVQSGLLVYSHAVQSRIDAAGRSYVKYYMERLKVGEELSRMPSINVPGIVVALRDRGETALTLDRTWNEKEGRSTWYTQRTWLNALLIDDDHAVRTDVIELGSDLASMDTQGDFVYAVSNRYIENATESYSYRTTLFAVDVSDPWALEVSSEQVIGQDWWTIAGLTSDTLALSGSGGLALFDLEKASTPSFDRFTRTQGWAVSILQDARTLFLSGGPYGIQKVTLD